MLVTSGIWAGVYVSRVNRERDADRAEFLRRQDENDREWERYWEQELQAYLQEVIKFEQAVPEKYRSQWWFARWCSTHSHKYFEWSWKSGPEPSGQERHRKDFLERLPYPRYVDKDLNAATREARNEEDFLEGSADVLAYFNGDYQPSELWSVYAKIDAEIKAKRSAEDSRKAQLRKDMGI